MTDHPQNIQPKKNLSQLDLLLPQDSKSSLKLSLLEKLLKEIFSSATLEALPHFPPKNRKNKISLELWPSLKKLSSSKSSL